MLSTMVRNQIEATLNAPQGRAGFAERVDAIATSSDTALSSVDLDAIAVLAEQYVRGTLRLMESCDVAARQARAEGMFEPLLRAAGDGFMRPIDHSPAEIGLLDMISDSYFARTLLKQASEHVRVSRGFALFTTDPNSDASVIAAILGPKAAAELDDRAAALLEAPILRHAMQNTYLLQAPLRVSGEMNDWGGGWRGEVDQFCKTVGLALVSEPASGLDQREHQGRGANLV
ncbi:MAG: hypothetical protein AAF401_06630 [Pseudomonadota bacterium]